MLIFTSLKNFHFLLAYALPMKNLTKSKTCGIKHFGLSVASLEQSIHFYCDTLGLQLTLKRKNDAFFNLEDGSVFALLQYPNGKKKFDLEIRPKLFGKNFTHYGFSARSEKDVFAFQKFLQKKNVPISKQAYSRWDGASLYFTDPNGYTIEYIYLKPHDTKN